MDGNGLPKKIEVGENDERLMRAIIAITPAIAVGDVEEVCHQTVRVTYHGIRFFKHACPLKFSQAFQLIERKARQKVKYVLPDGGSSGPEKCTDQRRARGDSGQS